MADSRRPLEGVKCVCVIMFQAAPVAFSMMADLGAEVIKIEEPGVGELGRQLVRDPDFPLSPYFEANNRGFKSLSLNLRHEKSKEILYKLVKDADIFAQNFRPGVAERRGFAYEDLVKVNPSIVYLNVSAYGPEGPLAGLPGTDGMAQAAGGIASVFGEEGSPMVTGQVAVADETAAYINFQAAMVGLYHKKMTGEGQKIDTSLLGGQVRLMGHTLTRYLFTGQMPRRSRARIFPGATPGMSANFYDKDGKGFLIQVIGEDRWQAGIKNAGLVEVLADAGCAKLGDIANSQEKQKTFFEVADRLFGTDSRDRWVKAFRDADIVCAPINNLAEVAADPQNMANQYIIEVDHPKAGKIREVGFPWRFSKTPARAGIAPELGEHNSEILKGLGYSDAEIEQLAEQGVI